MRRIRSRAHRRWLAGASVLVAALWLSLPLAADQPLTVVSFGGSYARACQQVYHVPFTAATGIEVRLEDYNGGLAQIRAQVETGNVHWDVVDLNVADAVLGCDEVVMSTAYNGRIFNAQVLENQPFEIVWDGQILDNSQLVIVAGTRNLEAARKFIAFAGRPESMAAVSRYISYGPVRRSGTALVGTHLETGVEMAPHMPTTPANLTRALHHDWRWWSDHGDELTERFSRLAGALTA